MDISVASNFERLLYDFYLDCDSNLCSKLYSKFPDESINVNETIWKQSSDLFISYSSDDISTYKCMQFYYENYDYIMDPHTAVAADAVKSLKNKLQGKTIILSTAHPAKFPSVLKNAGLSVSNIPNKLSEVLNKNEVAKKLSALDESIFEYIKENN